MQLLPVAKRCLMTSILSGVKAEPPSAALSGLSAIWTLNPGLAPWAVLLDPFGVLGFAPETSLTLTTGAQNVRKLLILRSSIQKVFTTLLTLRQEDSRPGCKFVGAAEAAEPGAVAAIAIDDPSQVACSGEG